MEIEVLLPLKSTDSVDEYISSQRNFLERISFAAGTFQMFAQVNEVIDVNKRKLVKRTSRLAKIFKSTEPKAFVFVLGKN